MVMVIAIQSVSCEKFIDLLPGKDPVVTDTTNYVPVTNTAELLAAMQNAEPGDVILCAGGSYDQLVATNIQKTGMVYIRAANRNNPPVFSSHNALLLKQLRNFTFDGLKFDGSSLQDAFGYPSSRAIRYGFSQNVTFRNCHFDFWYIGMEQLNEPNNTNQNIIIEYNKFTRRGMDGIRIFRPHNGLIIRHNLVENDYIDSTRSRNAERHPDVIQFAAINPYSPASKNVLIEKNQFMMADTYSHGIFMSSDAVIQSTPVEPAPAYYFDSVEIRSNDIMAPHINAIGIAGFKNLLITGNRIQKTPGTYHLNDPRGRPRINVYSYCSGTISNNTGPFAPNAYHSGALANMNITSDNNWTAGASPTGWVDISDKVGPYAYEN